MIALILPGISRAESKDTKTIELNVVQVMQLAGDFVEQEKLDATQDILTKVPNTGNPALETERWFLRAQIATRNGDIDGANAYRIQDFYKRVWASYFFLNAIAKTVAPATNIIPDSNCPIVRPQLVKKPIWMSGARNCSHKIRNTAYSIANIPPSAPG